jgi:hypothetical protein
MYNYLRLTQMEDVKSLSVLIAAKGNLIAF